MMEGTAGSFEMTRTQFRLPCDSICAGWGLGGSGWRGRTAKIKEKGEKTLANDHDSRKNMTRTLNSYQRAKLVVVRG